MENPEGRFCRDEAHITVLHGSPPSYNSSKHAHIVNNQGHFFVIIDSLMLTHISQIDFQTLTNWMSPFQVLGLLDGNFFYSNLNRIFC